MEESITKDDLRQFGLILIGNIREMIEKGAAGTAEDIHPEWLKSGRVRKILDISPGTLQNLRVTGKVRHKKVLGSYYYNRADLHSLFGESK